MAQVPQWHSKDWHILLMLKTWKGVNRQRVNFWRATVYLKGNDIKFTWRIFRDDQGASIWQNERILMQQSTKLFLESHWWKHIAIIDGLRLCLQSVLKQSTLLQSILLCVNSTFPLFQLFSSCSCRIKSFLFTLPRIQVWSRVSSLEPFKQSW